MNGPLRLTTPWKSYRFRTIFEGVRESYPDALSHVTGCTHRTAYGLCVFRLLLAARRHVMCRHESKHQSPVKYSVVLRRGEEMIKITFRAMIGDGATDSCTPAAGQKLRRPANYNSDDEQVFLDLLRRQAEEEDRRRFVTALRRLRDAA